MKAMILAAGFGTRLLPYTLTRPKPLFPVLGRPLLEIIIGRLRQSGFSAIVVNTHHLCSQIVELFSHEKDIFIQEEKSILGTGGGLRQALEFFEDEPFLVVNADIYHDIDFREVYEKHVAARNRVTMVLHNNGRFNKVVCSKDGRISTFSGLRPHLAIAEEMLAFTGVHVVNPEVLANIPCGQFSNIIDHYTDYIQEGGCIDSIKCSVDWWDIGTPEDYLALHGALLTNERMTRQLQPLSDGNFFGDEHVVLGKGVTLSDWGMIGAGAVIGDEAQLERVVVWDGARVEAGAFYKDTILC